MSFRTISLSLLLLMGVFFVFSAFFSHSEAKKGMLVAFYNVENLFDTLDNPHTSDNDFLPSSSLKWDQVKYRQKLERLSQVVKILNEEGLMLLGLAEIENKQVLDDLVQSSDQGLAYVHQESGDPRGIDVALLYKKKLFKVLFHKILPPCDAGVCLQSRDILVVKGLFQKDTIWVFVNHWPSRRVGQEKSEYKRLLLAKVLKHAVDSVLHRSPSSKIIVMGDFNDLPTDASLRFLTQDRSLVNVFDDEELMRTGSFKYKKEWLLYDQVLLSSHWMDKQKNQLHYENRSASVFHPNYLYYKSSQKNGPYRSYRGQTYYGGYSDHFPVYIRLND